jgi:siderophore synthetase component
MDEIIFSKRLLKHEGRLVRIECFFFFVFFFKVLAALTERTR